MALQREETSFLQSTADFLSIITVAICFVLKVPQIVTIVKVKNAEGISTISLLLDVFSYTVMLSYNYRSDYALLSYLEYPIILVQQYVLIAIVFTYKDMLDVKCMIGTSIYIAMTISFMSGAVPKELLMFLVPLCTPIGASSKVIQLVTILQSKNSESVSVLTWFISAFTNITRIFTICVESMDTTLLLNFIVNSILSTSVMVAAWWYKKPKQD